MYKILGIHINSAKWFVIFKKHDTMYSKQGSFKGINVDLNGRVPII